MKIVEVLAVPVSVPLTHIARGDHAQLSQRHCPDRHGHIRIDCNTGFGLEDALRFLEGGKPLAPEFVEQSIAADNLAGLRKCREVGVPLSVDESLNSLADALALVSESACDVFNIKVPKVGGLTLSKKIAAAANNPAVVGGRTTLELSRYASRHFAASTPNARGRALEGRDRRRRPSATMTSRCEVSARRSRGTAVASRSRPVRVSERTCCGTRSRLT